MIPYPKALNPNSSNIHAHIPTAPRAMPNKVPIMIIVFLLLWYLRSCCSSSISERVGVIVIYFNGASPQVMIVAPALVTKLLSL